MLTIIGALNFKDVNCALIFAMQGIIHAYNFCYALLFLEASDGLHFHRPFLRESLFQSFHVVAVWAQIQFWFTYPFGHNP